MRRILITVLATLALAGCQPECASRELPTLPPPSPTTSRTMSREDALEEAEWFCKNYFDNDPEARSCQVLKEHPEYAHRLP